MQNPRRADALGRCPDRGLRRGHRKARRDRDLDHPGRVLPTKQPGRPDDRASKLTQGSDARSAAHFRHAMRREQARAGADDRPHRADARGDHAAVGQDADTHRHVDMVVDQLESLVDEHEPDRDIGVGRQEIPDDREDVKAAEQDRRGHDQFAPRRREFAGGGLLRRLDLARIRLAAAT